MSGFANKAATFPAARASLARQADSEIARHVANVSMAAKTASDALSGVGVIADGALTAAVTLGAHGTTHAIPHGLQRKPSGAVAAQWTGFEPRFRVTSMDAKYINIVSMDQVDIDGWFVTDAPGTGIASGSGALWTPSWQSTGVYRVTLTDAFPTLLSGRADINNGVATERVFLSTASMGASPYVEFTHAAGGVAADAGASVFFFRVSVTGTATPFKLWVF